MHEDLSSIPRTYSKSWVRWGGSARKWRWEIPKTFCLDQLACQSFQGQCLKNTVGGYQLGTEVMGMWVPMEARKGV